MINNNEQHTIRHENGSFRSCPISAILCKSRNCFKRHRWIISWSGRYRWIISWLGRYRWIISWLGRYHTFWDGNARQLTVWTQRICNTEWRDWLAKRRHIFLTLILLNQDMHCLSKNSVDLDQMAIWSRSTLFVIQFVNLCEQTS